MCRAALRQLLDSDRFGEWRSGLNRAVQNAFGNLPPGLPDEELLRLFRSRAAAFAASLPEMAAAADTSALADALRGAMLAARLNAFLPASVWRDSPPAGGDAGDTAAFYDPAQPRDSCGRWTGGIDVNAGIKLPRKELELPPSRLRSLLDVYAQRGGKALAHNGLPGTVEVTRNSCGHHKHQRNLQKFLQLRNAVIMRPQLMQTLFRRGHLAVEQVRREKNGIADKNKRDWKRCWHIRGNIRINAAKYAYDFTVFQHTGSGKMELYDFMIKDI